jgi:hypothetical protein
MGTGRRENKSHMSDLRSDPQVGTQALTGMVEAVPSGL